MVVAELIVQLSCSDSNLNVMGCIKEKTNELLYVDIFGNSHGLPAIHLSTEVPMQTLKTCGGLIKELQLWMNESIHYDPKAPVYLARIFEYEDNSYDFRYFELEGQRWTQGVGHRS